MKSSHNSACLQPLRIGATNELHAIEPTSCSPTLVEHRGHVYATAYRVVIDAIVQSTEMYTEFGRADKFLGRE
jgi:hypothetical protein